MSIPIQMLLGAVAWEESASIRLQKEGLAVLIAAIAEARDGPWQSVLLAAWDQHCVQLESADGDEDHCGQHADNLKNRCA